MIKVIMFDFDGVIVDSVDIVFNSFKRISKKYDFKHFKNKRDFLKLYEGNFFERAVKLGISFYKLKEAMEARKEWLLKNYFKAEVFSGMEEVIKRLNKRYKLVMVSSANTDIILKMLRKKGLDSYFKDVLGADKAYSKSKKIKMVIKKYNVSKDETIFITDTIGDVKETNNVGVNVVGVSWGFHGSRLKKYRCEYVKSPKEILDVIENGR